MQLGLIGVIVPVYKIEKYIAECIESILAQTYTNFRLILVNDGTPDNAGKICDEYAKKDSRITVIHQKNAGVTRARARGVEEAKDCEFIMFVDGDDTIAIGTLQYFKDEMSEDCNIVIGLVEGYSYYVDKKITKERYLHSLISRSDISPAPWAKLFRTEILTEDVFDIPREIVYGEDLIMNIRAGLKANNVNVLHQYTYRYRNNAEGCENTFTTTPEYENLFFSHLISSIPSKEQDKYYNDTIKRRILVLEKEIGYKCRPEKKWFNSRFQVALLRDINKYNYKYPYLKRMLFKIENSLLRSAIILIVKTNNILKKL